MCVSVRASVHPLVRPAYNKQSCPGHDKAVVDWWMDIRSDLVNVLQPMSPDWPRIDWSPGSQYISQHELNWIYGFASGQSIKASLGHLLITFELFTDLQPTSKCCTK